MELTGETISYRPVSRLAVAAAVTGVLASLALTTPMLWIVPLVGVALAVAGLLDVARPGAEKAGRAAALVGLALSVGFGVQAVTTALVSRWIVESRVEAVVGVWLDAIRDGRLSDARRMLSPSLLPHGDSPDAAFGGPGHRGHDHDHEPEVSIDTLPAVAALLGCGADALREVRCTGRDEETGERWVATVRLRSCGDGKAVALRLEVAPSAAKEGAQPVERWTILKIDET